MFLNLAGYRFVDLQALCELRDRIDERGRAGQLRGTVLLAPEGINLSVCAEEGPARSWLAQLLEEPCLAGLGDDPLQIKESRSEEPSFDRWKVRIKREIITFGQPVKPAAGRAAAVSAATLRRWLDRGSDDQGRRLALVDTRNRMEVQAGTFEGALDLALDSFSRLPDAVLAQREVLRNRRVVTFCTGGIRCEKAALWMGQAGFEHVVQLDGGVLRWFEEQQGAHWRGELFVFDKRGGLDRSLKPAK